MLALVYIFMTANLHARDLLEPTGCQTPLTGEIERVTAEFPALTERLVNEGLVAKDDLQRLWDFTQPSATRRRTFVTVGTRTLEKVIEVRALVQKRQLTAIETRALRDLSGLRRRALELGADAVKQIAPGWFASLKKHGIDPRPPFLRQPAG